MHIVKADGSVGVVFAWTLVPGVSVMYNLEVQQDHTFTVGDGQWVVHNTGRCGDGPDPVGDTKHMTDKQLKKLGLDAHQLKHDILGDDAPIAQFDIYKDEKDTLYLMPKQGGSINNLIYVGPLDWYQGE